MFEVIKVRTFECSAVAHATSSNMNAKAKVYLSFFVSLQQAEIEITFEWEEGCDLDTDKRLVLVLAGRYLWPLSKLSLLGRLQIGWIRSQLSRCLAGCDKKSSTFLSLACCYPMLLREREREKIVPNF